MRQINLKNYYSYIPFIILFCIFILIHLNLRQTGDDLLYSQVIILEDYKNIVPVIIERYYDWSSRFIIEADLMILTYLPMKVWKFLDSLVLVFIAILIPKLFSFKEKFKNKDLINNSISSILVLLFFYFFYEPIALTGWISVTLNYIWPIFFILLHFYLLKEYILKRKDLSPIKKIIIYLLLIYSLLFTCNHEQFLCVFLGLYFILIIYNFYKKRNLPKIVYLMLILAILEFMFILTAPGNSHRYLIELRWFGEYADLTLLNKIDIGFTSFYRIFFSDINTIALLFLGFFGFYNYINLKSIKDKIISFIPFIMCLISNTLIYIQFEPYIAFIGNGNSVLGLGATELKYIIAFILIYLVLTITMLYGLYKLYKNKNKKIAILILLLLLFGFGTNFMMAFTPTVWVSKSRTIIPLIIFLIIGIYILITNLIDSKVKT